MRKFLFAVAIFAFAACLAASPLLAQSGPPGQAPQQGAQAGPGGPGGPGGPPGMTSTPQTMDLATAKNMVAAAEAAATAANAHVAICVMDTNGDVVFFERMDGAPTIAVVTSQNKARAVLLFGMATGKIAEAMQGNKPVTANITAQPMEGGGAVTLMRGGLPIVKNGKLIGAIGAGGSASETDEKFSQAGIDAINK
jgi:glc operon protein GlcG